MCRGLMFKRLILKVSLFDRRRQLVAPCSGVCVLGCFFGLGFAAFSGCVFARRCAVGEGWFWRCVFVPLTEKVVFKTRLQRGDRLQVNKYVRWRYKLESNQFLSVRVNVPSIWDSSGDFLCRMTKDGRIVIPKLTMACLKKEKPNLDDYLVEVTLQPF